MLNFFKKKKQNTSLLAEEEYKGRPKFYSLKVSDITRETEDAVSVAFEIPEKEKDVFKFKPGQYLTIEQTINGEDVRRSYSLCSSPLDGEIRVAIKKVDGGKFSTYANTDMTVGEEMKVMDPQGNFVVEPNESSAKKYVAFASGSGITPIYSIMKSVLELEPKSEFVLFYGNKTSNTVIFKDQIEGLKNRFLNRLEVHHILSREDQGTDYLKGRLNAEKCTQFAQNFFDINEVDQFLICGPGDMITNVSDKLIELGAPKDKVLFEMFTSPDAGKKEQKKTAKKSEEVILSKVTVILDSDETHVDIKSDGRSILDAALDAGADVPYACKGAVCCTCRAKVLEGKVEMDMNYALEEEEVEEGYILTCQAHPQTEKVVVSFDD